MGPEVILLGHGSGGRLSHQLLEELVAPTLGAGGLAARNDAALLPSPGGRLTFSADGFTVDPIFFPGGDIGALAVNGTVNDLAMMASRPLWLSVGLILEEGLPLDDLRRILVSMRRASDAAGVRIVAGDTKVVPRGKADRLFVSTSGIGVVEHGLTVDGTRARPGDAVVLSGTIGDHGVAVMACREGLALETPVASDCASLAGLVAELVTGLGADLHVLRDPTRGGVATTLKEIALQSGVDLLLREEAVPVRPAVGAACSILGLDPLHVANEGKLVAIVAPEAAARAVAVLRRDPLGADAAVVGEVTGAGAGRVSLLTRSGRTLVVEMPSGAQLPRIC